jgi:hypothetical protein
MTSLMKRAYYSNSIERFLHDSSARILGLLAEHHQFALEDLQKNAWVEQIAIMKRLFANHPEIQGHIYFEFAIPRMGKRVDVVLLIGDVVFVLEFKVGEKGYPRYAIDQAVDYCLDLKNFHAESHDRKIVPILVSTNAPEASNELGVSADQIFFPLCANQYDLICVIQSVPISPNDPINPESWAASIYKPTPTIIEAAQALYRGHSVDEISRSDSGAINLSRTAYAIAQVIDNSKQRSRKSICFITGVPGAGKTLAGLNIANLRHDFEAEEHAVFLSGNGPLVDVLREALARNEVDDKKNSDNRITKAAATTKAKSFIQNIHHFRDDALSSDRAPIEKVVVFDEAQRAWTKEQTASFMKQKKGIPDFGMSEPDFLISVMDRHQDWAVIICLIGGGQEINRGEAGLPEWFNALEEGFPQWDVYVSDKLTDDEYTMGNALYPHIQENRTAIREDLHLGVSIRSFRSEKQSDFVKALLDDEPERATSIFFELKTNFPMVVTRDLDLAKNWLRSKARGNERFGIIASSGANRLRPEGINIKAKIEPKNWFLNSKDDVRSSYFLEEVATEFDIQGLELDWVCVGWDGNFCYSPGGWQYRNFSGTKWQNINDASRQLFLKNSYRVLLTRARQGMVIYVPYGSETDATRSKSFYDPTFNFLRRIGIPELTYIGQKSKYTSII